MKYNSRRNNNTLFPHKITLDTNTKKYTAIRKNDLAIVIEIKPRETTEKPRLIHMVACKTVRE